VEFDRNTLPWLPQEASCFIGDVLPPWSIQGTSGRRFDREIARHSSDMCLEGATDLARPATEPMATEKLSEGRGEITLLQLSRSVEFTDGPSKLCVDDSHRYYSADFKDRSTS
jgi:hypothetical protein